MERIIILVYLSILLEKLLTLSMYALPEATSNLDSCKGLKLHMFQGVCTVTLGIARSYSIVMPGIHDLAYIIWLDE